MPVCRYLKYATQLFYGAVIAVLWLVSSEPASAGAWPQEKGVTETITTFTMSRASHAFNDKGKAIPAPTFKKDELNVYTEYGFSRSLTVVLNASGAKLHPEGSPAFIGAGETGAGLRQRLWHKTRHVISVQASALLPGNTTLTSGGIDTEAQLNYGLGFKVFRMEAFADAGVGYRYRAHDFRDELRPDITFGVRPADRWLVLGQSFNVFTMGRGRTDVFQGRQSKAQLSAVYRLTPSFLLQLGGQMTFAGKDVPKERALVASIWLRLGKPKRPNPAAIPSR